MFKYLKEKWQLKNNWQVFLILIVFACTGSTVMLLKPYFFRWIGFEMIESAWLKTFVYLVIMLPLYQMLLLVYGAIFGQFSFFWAKEKALFQRISQLWKKKSKKND